MAAAATRQGVVVGQGEAAGQVGALVAGLVDQEAGVVGQVSCCIVGVFCLHAVPDRSLFGSGPFGCLLAAQLSICPCIGDIA
jgi:hypothetical protein